MMAGAAGDAGDAGDAGGAVDAVDAGGPGEAVILGLGSNLGDRIQHLRSGIRKLESFVDVRSVSPVVESAAHGSRPGDDDPDFLNAVLEVRTNLEPMGLLRVCQSVEDQEGRARLYPGAPRTLDVDILFYGERVIGTRALVVPHPRWKEREFVLVPLREIDRGWRDPETGESIQDIVRARLPVLGEARVVAPPAALRAS